MQKGDCTFTRKRLIDVFVYTQYAHQPDERRQRQFGECLKEVNDLKPVLTWLFLTEMWKACLKIKCAGKVIAGWFDRYCEHHGVSHDIHPSVAESNPGIGAKEKEADRKARLIREKAETLAADIWRQQGSPPGGPAQFLYAAKRQLDKALGA